MQSVWISVWHTMLQETPGSHSNLQMITCSVYYFHCYFDACLSWFLDFSSTCWDNKAQNDGNAVSCIHLVWLHYWESLHLCANSCFYCHTTDFISFSSSNKLQEYKTSHCSIVTVSHYSNSSNNSRHMLLNSTLDFDLFWLEACMAHMIIHK